ncbi:hypothetical protein FRB94_012699 [Tulasnella sp. JGI-2019a]|nr:hypothetical protein FRB94_012699 [Tulasnella sp. JGI-2019a]
MDVTETSSSEEPRTYFARPSQLQEDEEATRTAYGTRGWLCPMLQEIEFGTYPRLLKSDVVALVETRVRDVASSAPTSVISSSLLRKVIWRGRDTVPMSMVNNHEVGWAGEYEPLTLQDSTFDITSWVNDSLNTDEDVLAVVGGGTW